MRLLLLISLITISLSSVAAVYRWVDENGKVHYSDEPRENATEVQLNDNTQNNITVVQPTPITRSTKPSPDAQPNYKVVIASPAEEATIRDNNGNITVTANIEPKLPKGAFFTLSLNGQLKVQPQTSSIFRLTNIDRGAHTIVVNVVTQNGKVLASSPARTVFLHRASVIGRG
ncbi:DUF4124 domain-containing protein [Shewanella sp. WXL01]|uniref:DUF4124 domain-containing protein n=1 Tax=Shewanella sp. WXL01 TaxID=2709721 RepID=UPI00143869B5|nr:DUF4124 domain-containing protein [Shewanella sp. WXL01]NKF52160.1 DUF4124 domain-containing protein [Shewanella sp. WXL01]